MKKQKHHYCPVFYLKGFVNAKGKLWRYDKYAKDQPWKEVYPSEVMFEIDRNAITIDDGTKDYIIERTLSKIESSFANSIRTLQDNRYLDNISSKIVVDLMKFIAIQKSRTPHFEEEMVRIFPKIGKVENSMFRFLYAIAMVKTFKDVPQHFSFLYSKNSFLVSDIPYFEASNPKVKFIPISKHLVINMIDSHETTFSKQRLNKEKVDQINFLSVKNSKRYIVGHSKKIIQDTCKKFPSKF